MKRLTFRLRNAKQNHVRVMRVLLACMGFAVCVCSTLWITGANSLPQAAVQKAVVMNAVGYYTGGTWVDLGSGNWIWRPDDICDDPWIVVFGESEDEFRNNAVKNPTGRNYNATEQAALFHEWDNCGGGTVNPPSLPPLLPPGDGPLPPPNRPDPICVGFGCNLDPPLGPPPGGGAPDPIWCVGLPCGWPTPKPIPGGGTPNPGEVCLGINCPGIVHPKPPPTNPGPNPWDICLGINCPGVTPPVNPGPGPGCGGGGGGTPCLSMNPEDCEPPGPIEVPPLNPPPPLTFPPANPPQEPVWVDGGPSIPVATPNPVDFAHGHKHESEIDLLVPLTGRDFVVSRSYTSKANMGGSNLVGANWSLNLFHFLEKVGTGTTAPLRLSTPSGGSRTFSYNSTELKWLPSGPSSQFIVKTYVDIGAARWPVYQLVEPGAWSLDFFRANETGESGSPWQTTPSTHLGLMLQEREVYSANKTTYTYTVFNQNNGNANDDAARLSVVYMNGTDATNSAASANFEWYDLNDTNLGRLKKVTINRYPSGTATPVQKVEYTYKRAGDAYSTAVGTEGDLIQVVKSTLVDRAPTSESPWHITVIQYRYHGGTSNESGTDSDSDGFENESGYAHQLKAVLMPEQIEYAAQRASSGTPHYDTVKTYAAGLLDDADGAEAFEDPVTLISYKVMDLAAKVIEKYNTFNPTYPDDYPGRVNTQYVQSACGCSSGSSQGLMLQYDYWFDYNSDPDDGEYVRTTRVTYSQRDEEGNYDPHLTHYYDLVQYTINSGSGTAATYYLSNSVIDDGTNRWVVHSDYHSTTRVLTRTVSPSAINSYTPATSTTAPSTIDPLNSDGLVQEYEYTSQNRLKQLALRKGETGAINIVTRSTFDSTRPWLPTKHETFRLENLTSGNASAGADDIQVVDFRYGYHGSTDAIAWIETKFEAEKDAENGPGGSYYSYSFFDTNGRNHWTRLADHTLIERTYDNPTGNVLTSEANSTDSGLPSHPTDISEVEWDGRNADGGSLTTTYAYDLLGRIKSMTLPTGVVVRYSREIRAFDDTHHDDRPGILHFAVVGLPYHFTEGGNDKFAGPANLEFFNASGDSIASIDYSLTPDSTNGYGSLFSGYTFNLGSELARQTVSHGLSGLVMTSTQWHSVAGQGDNGGYYETTYTYDSLGRLSKQVVPNGTITKYAYDTRSRIKEVKVGTIETGGSANMQVVSEMFYDTKDPNWTTNGVGDGALTFIRQHTGESSPLNHRDTKLNYDYRSRLIKVENAASPHAFFVYDNVDNIVKAALFKQLPSGIAPSDIDHSSTLTHRGIYTESSYSQRGLPYRSRIAIDPESTSSAFLETHAWHDALGRVIAQWAPNSPGIKTTYNALGQAKTVYMTDRGGDGLPGSGSFTYALTSDHPYYKANVTGDVVFEQATFQYRSTLGLLDLMTVRIRTHDAADSKTGDLASFSGGDVNLVVSTFEGLEYDKAGRLVSTVDFGTNSSSGFVANTSAPSLDSATPPRWIIGSSEITVSMAYNAAGQIDHVLDPMGKKTVFYYDNLNRAVATVQNQQEATVSWDGTLLRWKVTDTDPGEDDADRVTSTTFSITQNKVEQYAHHLNTGGTDSYQLTKYLTAIADGESGPNLSYVNGLLRRIVYPDTETSQADHSVGFAYTRLGEVRYTKDQNATTHTFTRDLLGRITQDTATVDSGSAIDSTIDIIAITYDDYSRPTSVQSKSGSTVKNAVEFTYNDLWQVENITQKPIWATSATHKTITYAYSTVNAATSDGNFSRPLSLTYPDTSVLTVEYEPSGASPHPSGYRASRPHGLKLGTQSIVEYDYVGLGNVVLLEYVQPGVILDRALAHDGSRTTGSYPGFDRFGRIVRQTWADATIAAGTGSGAGYPTKPPILEQVLTYDKASNITENYDARPGAAQTLNRQYTYDGLHRLKEAKKGLGNGGSFALAPGSQKWELDAIGNWRGFNQDLGTDGLYQTSNDKVVAGSFNLANEITSLSQTIAGTNTTLGFTYDKAGNLREQKLTSTTAYRYTYDAWNRLVKVQHVTNPGGSEVIRPRGEYEYNGAMQRIIKRSDANTLDGTTTLNEQRLMYYSAGWQLIEERIDDSWSSGHTTDRIVQHVWGARYIDDAALLREDISANGTYDLTWYHITNHQFSTVALVDGSANLVERVDYSSYGGDARHQYKQDVDADGDIDSADQGAVTAANNKRIYQSGYNVHADFNRDGLINSSDTHLVGSGFWTSALPAGQLSAVGNVVGYAGYIFNSEFVGGGNYTVRFRHYDPIWGRWISRDPAGYQDTMSLYGYGFGNPVWGTDPLGLDWLDNLSNWGAGFGDTLTFGLTKKVRQWLDYDDVVDYDSTAYSVGELTGAVVGVVVGGVAIRGTVIALGAVVRSGGAVVQIAFLELATGGTIPVVIVNGQAVALTVAALVEAGLTVAFAQQVVDSYGHLLGPNGNRIGPSGKESYHYKHHPTRKRMNDAARNEGKGKPKKSNKGEKGPKHVHPTGSNGKQIPGSTHHTCPQIQP